MALWMMNDPKPELTTHSLSPDELRVENDTENNIIIWATLPRSFFFQTYKNSLFGKKNQIFKVFHILFFQILKSHIIHDNMEEQEGNCDECKKNNCLESWS